MLKPLRPELKNLTEAEEPLFFCLGIGAPQEHPKREYHKQQVRVTKRHPTDGSWWVELVDSPTTTFTVQKDQLKQWRPTPELGDFF